MFRKLTIVLLLAVIACGVLAYYPRKSHTEPTKSIQDNLCQVVGSLTDTVTPRGIPLKTAEVRDNPCLGFQTTYYPSGFVIDALLGIFTAIVVTFGYYQFAQRKH